MRILQIGPIPPEVGGTTTGGVATHTWQLSTHLALKGHEVAIIADNLRASSPLPLCVDGVTVYGTSYGVNSLITNWPSLLLNVPTLFRLKQHCSGVLGLPATIVTFTWYDRVFRTFAPDVVHVHHLERRFPFAYYASRRRSIPVVTTVHSTTAVKFAAPGERQRNLSFIRRNAALAQDIVFGFKTRMDQFLSFLDDKEQQRLRCWLVPYPMDLSLYHILPRDAARSRLGIVSGRPIVLFAANLVPLKGARTLLKAADLLNREHGQLDFDVLIAGGGPQQDELALMISECGLGGYVSLLGSKTSDDLLYYYNAANLYVIPSEEEALPTTAFEAMQCGCPVVISTSVAAEMLPPSDVAYQVPVKDETALAKAILLCLKYAWDRCKIAGYTQQFDWEQGTKANVNGFEDLYSEVIRARKSSSN